MLKKKMQRSISSNFINFISTVSKLELEILFDSVIGIWQ